MQYIQIRKGPKMQSTDRREMIEMENDVLKAIKNRKSTRSYKDTQITEQELKTLLDSALQAPSAMNSQPWHFTVVQNVEMIDRMSEKTKEVMRESENSYVSNVGKGPMHVFYNAPTVIVVSGKKDVSSSLVDCSAAIENMLIAAESINIGTDWVGFVRALFTLEEEVKRFELPDGYEPFYAVAIGYKKDDKERGPSERNKDVINYLR